MKQKTPEELAHWLQTELTGAALPSLSSQHLTALQELRHLIRGDILKMTYLAKSGHPGGSLSSADMFLTVWLTAGSAADRVNDPQRDRIVISHGHTSPAAYSVLGRLGFFDVNLAIVHFRQVGSPFEGHVEANVPGIEWSTGNLGQGLSAACGFAVACKLRQLPSHVYCLMSDGEQAKGQVAEARRFAHKFQLDNLTVLIDYNQRQICGDLHRVMPVNIKENYLADGWQVLEVDGHDFPQLYQALRQTRTADSPVAIIAHTAMGKGISFMENDAQFHGRALKPDEFSRALAELDIEDDTKELLEQRASFRHFTFEHHPAEKLNIEPGEPLRYEPGEKTDNRTAFGRALVDLVQRNLQRPDSTPIIAFDCDLLPSVKINLLQKEFPKLVYESGVQEHTTATIAGAASAQGVLSFFADFGVFGIDETYNQHRLNDINHTNLKLVLTHCGIDVGQDGKTHQCIDYVGLLQLLPGFRLIVPADPNQTDRVIRYVATQPGNFCIAMGRSLTPIIVDQAGSPLFAGKYEFEYGKAEVVHPGKDVAIITLGGMLWRALKAAQELSAHNLSVMVINMSCPLHPDLKVLKKAIACRRIVTYEDHLVAGGLATIVARNLVEQGWQAQLIPLGLTHYAGSGASEELYQAESLTPERLRDTIISLMK